METKYLLTQYAHGGGCGCKIAPGVLEEILKTSSLSPEYPALLVGNASRDDAAAFDLGNGTAIISTTDFFTPIVNDAYDFGRIAAANAISDVYAMGGRPIMAIAILGWPVDKLPASEAQRVLEGARHTCREAGIPLAGGHSIDTTEPIFGLAVTGVCPTDGIKQNNTAHEGDLLLLTKPIGTGILAAAEKKGLLDEDQLETMHRQLSKLNNIGEALSILPGVHAMTDVTGFGLAGHLIEMADGSGLSANISFSAIPKMEGLEVLMMQNVGPDATFRNWTGYGSKIDFAEGVDVLEAFKLLPDPQTNGGLLIAVAPNTLGAVQELLMGNDLANFIHPIGILTRRRDKTVYVTT